MVKIKTQCTEDPQQTQQTLQFTRKGGGGIGQLALSRLSNLLSSFKEIIYPFFYT